LRTSLVQRLAILLFFLTLDSWGAGSPLPPLASSSKDSDPSVRKTKEFIGIGALLAKTDSGFPVIWVLPGSAASLSGLSPGAEIISLEGQQLASKTRLEVAAMIQGKSGTSVHIDFRDPSGEPKSATLVRGPVRFSVREVMAALDQQSSSKGKGCPWYRRCKCEDYCQFSCFQVCKPGTTKPGCQCQWGECTCLTAF